MLRLTGFHVTARVSRLLLMLIVRRAKISAKISAKKFGEKGHYEPIPDGLVD